MKQEKIKKFEKEMRKFNRDPGKKVRFHRCSCGRKVFSPWDIQIFDPEKMGYYCRCSKGPKYFQLEDLETEECDHEWMVGSAIDCSYNIICTKCGVRFFVNRSKRNLRKYGWKHFIEHSDDYYSRAREDFQNLDPIGPDYRKWWKGIMK